MMMKYSNNKNPITTFACDEINGQVHVDYSDYNGGLSKYIPYIRIAANRFYKGER